MMTLARLATARHCASTAFTARGAAHRAGTAAARLPARSVRVSAARWRPGDGTEDEDGDFTPMPFHEWIVSRQGGAFFEDWLNEMKYGY